MSDYKKFFANDFEYLVDETYKNPNRNDLRHGCIAVGTESIVYKGKKISKQSDSSPPIEIPCVLKFKPHHKYSDFVNRELDIFNVLSECRSIVKIDDVIKGEKKENNEVEYFQIGSYEGEPRLYFCVVEEYVDGMNLEEYCRDYWSKNNYEYKNILEYQKKVVEIMRQLSKIMEFVGEKQVLHLDIKPQNIMITKHDERVVLIDFGRAKKFISTDKTYAICDTQDENFSPEIDYGSDIVNGGGIPENQKYYMLPCRYGTLGYAPPECFSKPANNSKFPFDYDNSFLGKMDVSSDVFSFGATFWEVLNYVQLKNTNYLYNIKNNEHSIEYHNDLTHSVFYNAFINDNLYFYRDLFLTCMPKKNYTHFRPELEQIIIKCTGKYREFDKIETASEKRFNDFSEVSARIKYFEQSLPATNPEEKTSFKNSISVASFFSSLTAVSVIIWVLYGVFGTYIANNEWDNAIENYQIGDYNYIKEIAEERIKLGVQDAYNDVFALYNKENNLNENEISNLVDLLKISDLHENNINDIVKNTQSIAIVSDVSKKICELKSDDSEGYTLAFVISNHSESPVESYDALLKYQDNTEYKDFLIVITNLLTEEKYCKIIASSKNLTPSEIEDNLKRIKERLSKIEN